MRKIISMLLMVVILLTSTSFVSAEEYKESIAVTMLKKFGILNQDFVPVGSMRRIEFVTIISNIYKNDLNDYRNLNYFKDVSPTHYAANAINKLASYGFIKGGAGIAFNGDELITMDQAATILVRMLGYDVAAISAGGYPKGYNAVAADKGLFKGTSSQKSETENLLIMIYNALQVDIMEQNVFGSDDQFSINKDKTILSSVLKIEKYDGVVNAVGKKALSRRYGIDDDKVVINSQEFIINPSEKAIFEEYLGSEVAAYYTMNEDDEYVLLFCMKKNVTDVLLIDLADVLSISGNKIVYLNEADREEFAEIVPAPYIVYNNRPVTNLPLLGQNGTIKLVKNRSNDYDTLIIHDYKTYVVQSASGKNDTISSKLPSASLPKFDDTEKYSIKTKDGTLLTLDSLKEWDVLSMARSIDDEYIEIIVSRDTLNGKVEEIEDSAKSSEFKLVVNGNVYYVTEEYYNSIQPGTIDGKLGVAIGDEGIFYLDKDRKIAAFDKKAAGSMKVGFLVKMIEQDGVTDVPLAKIFTAAGKMEVKEVKTKSGKIKVNGEEVDVQQFIQQNEKTSGNGFNRQIIRYSEDASGKLTEIETSTDAIVKVIGGTFQTEPRREGLYQFTNPATGGRYRKGVKSIETNILLSDDIIIFVVPMDEVADHEDLYAIKKIDYLNDSQTYSSGRNQFYGYERDNFLATIMVRQINLGGDDFNNSTYPAIVKQINKTVNRDGDVAYKLYVIREGKELEIVGTSDPSLNSTLSSLNVGDIIRYNTNTYGEIGRLERIYDRKTDNFTGSADNNNGEYKARMGVVIERRGDSVMLGIPNGNSMDIEYYRLSSGSFMVYDSSAQKGKEVGMGDINDIRDAKSFPDNPSKVFIQSRYATPRSIIIYN